MRVSNGGRKVSSRGGSLSSSSIESTVDRGRDAIGGGSSPAGGDRNSLENRNVRLQKGENNLENKNINSSNGKKDSRQKIDKKQKIKNSGSIGKLSGGRVAGIILSGVVFSGVLGGITWGLYYNCVRYPWQVYGDVEASGLGGIRRWEECVVGSSVDGLCDILGSESYLGKEFEYANGSEDRIAFIERVLSLVSYTPRKVEAYNVYGNPCISRVDDKVIYTDSLVNDSGEEVTLSYIDYDNIPLDEEVIRGLVAESKLSLGEGDYTNGLVGVFCRYINSLDLDSIPLVSVSRVPAMSFDGGRYVMSAEEDIYLDKVLFSSDAFYGLLERFSEVACKGLDNPEWVIWNRLTEEEKKNTPEPSKVLEELPVTAEWKAWNDRPDEEKASISEPARYSPNYVISRSWCGAYYLLKEHSVLDSSGNIISKPVEAELGDGTFEAPASIGTGVVTSLLVRGSDGVRVAKPIKVKLVDYGVSQEAIDYFESKDTRNRGYDVKSGVQYVHYSFEVTNLSSEELVIYDNSSLSDDLANLAPRTGTVYGLRDSVVLKPYESGIIESWGCSTELNKKYLIWGGDFSRELPVVWFRVLAGDIDDSSEDKGVTLNDKLDESSDDTKDEGVDLGDEVIE